MNALSTTGITLLDGEAAPATWFTEHLATSDLLASDITLDLSLASLVGAPTERLVPATERTFLVALDVDQPAVLAATPDGYDARLREPDFREDGEAFWIGDRATVHTALPETALLDHLERGGFHTRMGREPIDLGIAVDLHDPEYVNGSCLVLGDVLGPVYSPWTIAWHTAVADA